MYKAFLVTIADLVGIVLSSRLISIFTHFVKCSVRSGQVRGHEDTRILLIVC